MRHAVMVAGHAIPRVGFRDPREDASWHLLEFQRREAFCYVEHIRAGVERAADEDALLIFSGGQTRVEAGRRSEAEGYRAVAEHYGWFGRACRVALEEYARDSFENLLFSLARFREVAGDWPERVTVVSWRFKEERFQMHRAAVGWPAERFGYWGVNDPPEREQAVAAEARNRAAYARDPYSASAEFRAKKVMRNPFGRRHGYGESCPELRALLGHEGPELFGGALPWRRAG
jgi:hypothetical protein